MTRVTRSVLVLILATVGFPAPALPESAEAQSLAQADTARTVDVAHVIHVSVDGLRPDAVTRRSAEALPNFYRLRHEGAYTDNARTDADYTNTLPNHVSQLTGRPVRGSTGHAWTRNRDPREGETLHTHRGEYVASVFDVLQDHGLRAAMYVSKSKFSLFDASYGEASYGDAPGAGARVQSGDAAAGEDRGKAIDRFVFLRDTDALVDTFVADLRRDPPAYAFLHLRDPDSAGHRFHWNMRNESAYLEAVERIDGLIGRILDAVDEIPDPAGETVIVLTTDHGGGAPWHRHGAADEPENYSIPFYVWGPGVCDTELYAANPGSRAHPGMAQPGYEVRPQPIRNGDAANLALSLLGLPPVPGSTINAEQDLLTCSPDR
ncbi:MAG: alkaline phosphatase family protein [Rhodothermales bacterium]